MVKAENRVIQKQQIEVGDIVIINKDVPYDVKEYSGKIGKIIYTERDAMTIVKILCSKIDVEFWDNEFSLYIKKDNDKFCKNFRNLF